MKKLLLIIPLLFVMAAFSFSGNVSEEVASIEQGVLECFTASSELAVAMTDTSDGPGGGCIRCEYRCWMDPYWGMQCKHDCWDCSDD